MGAYVLFVDDEPNILKALGRELRSWAALKGIGLLFAESGEAALAALEQNAGIALVVTDFRMPGMNGSQLIKAVRGRYPAAGTIMLTGFSDDDEVSRAISAGEKGYVKKPWDTETLIREMEAVLESGGAA